MNLLDSKLESVKFSIKFSSFLKNEDYHNLIWVENMSLSTDVNFNFGEGRGGCPVGSQGEFATFGFLSFITTMFSTIINMGQCICLNSVIDFRGASGFQFR